jgi:transposase
MVKIVCLRTSIVVTERKEKKRKEKKERKKSSSKNRAGEKQRERERETFFVRRVRGDTRVMMMMRLLYMNELTYGMQTGHFKRASTDHLQVAKVRS